MTKSICDLPPHLVGDKILAKVPITSLREVRSTCKLWEALSKDCILGKEAAKQQFLGFIILDFKVCSLRFNLRKDEDLLDISTKQVALLDQVEIYQVFHCDGLFLCVTKDNSRLVVWNPYLGQTKWIGPRTSFHRLDSYAVGYDINRNHKILRFLDYYDCNEQKHFFGFEIYDFNSNSWRVVDVRPDWEVEFYQLGVSLKGNTYFFAHGKLRADFFNPLPSPPEGDFEEDTVVEDFEDFLICFDFTRERFGPRLPLPFHSCFDQIVTLSCVREEQLAVLYHQDECDILEIWVTTSIEPNAVSWSKFLRVDIRQLFDVGVVNWFEIEAGSFFIDEEEKLAVLFELDGYVQPENPRYHTAFIFGDDGYFKSVSLGEATNVRPYNPPLYSPPLVCPSSYLPSLVQLNHKKR